MIRIRLVLLALLGPSLSASGPLNVELDRRIDQLFGSKKEFEAKTFGPARWAHDGSSFTVAEPSPATKNATDLVRYETESGRREVVVTAAQLTPAVPDAKPLSAKDHEWSNDGRWLLLFVNRQKVWRQQTRGDYWTFDRRSGRLRQLGGTAPPATLMFAKFSPDSTRVAYVREHNVYVEDLASGRIRQLTRDGSATVINGTGDWVNEEELGIRDGFRWSEDGRSIAFWQFDISGVGEYTLQQTTAGLYPELKRFPYPKAGTRNSAVRIGVVAASGGRTRWMDLPGDPREHYVARLAWTKETNELVMDQLDRRQSNLTVMVGDPRTGRVRTLFRDHDPAWVDVRAPSLWTHDGRHLIILSERDGWQRAYAVSRIDGSVRPLTPPAADVIRLVTTDAGDEWLYYLASPTQPTERHLYRVRLDGTGTAARISPLAQPGTHSYLPSPDGRFAFHDHSTFGRPTVTSLIRLGTHETIRPLEENQALRSKVEPVARPVEFFEVAVGGGARLDGWMIRPQNFDPGQRYPVIVFIYGEPASATVTDAWNGSRQLFHWALADAGYIVLSLDGRGTPAPKGRDWRKIIYREVNVLAVSDQTSALHTLFRQRPYLDANRVGVYGHSGGGSNTLNLMFRSPDTYHVGVASAPVSDLRLYDTIYQERYMDLPDSNPDGYRRASPITHAEGLRGKLLILHGKADDNVHFQNSERLINRLIELGKIFDVMVYPDGAHGLSEGKGYAVHRYRTIAQYFQTHLPPGGRPAPAGK